MKIFFRQRQQGVGEGICRNIGIRLGDSTVTTFSDGEISVSLYETVRGSDVFLVQATCAPSMTI
jgi:ribose-phosphate pyrophosphokinase